MPSKSEKQRKFFGAVMGAKKGKGKVKGAAKKVAKEMPEKEIKKFLKKESYDDAINSYLKKYLIEMDVRRDPREVEGIVDIQDIIDDEPTEDATTPVDNNEDYEEECESADQGCSCNECPACQGNQNKEPDILTFYGLK